MAFGQLFYLDLPLAMYFAAEVDGIIDTGFRTVTGLKVETGEYPIKQLNRLSDIQSLAGVRAGPVRLVKGLAFSDSLWRWFEQKVTWVKGQPDYRKSVSIVQLYPIKGILTEIRRWNLYKVHPIVFEAPDYDSNSNATAVQALVLAFDRIPELPYGIGAAGDLADVIAGLKGAW